VLGEIGVDLGKLPLAQPRAMGGPFVPAKMTAENVGFERQLLRISTARSQVDRLARALTAVPVRKPVPGEIDTTSGFGMRVDPFLHIPAMHTGLDFRGETGEAIRATAAGTVTHTGWSGGYGKMVEIDHGNGLSTRYGHLAAIEVEAGQSVRSGQIVGRMGSTGRSTGPHLHYETRVDGEAVDPQRFLRAGLRLAGVI
jgi:murein DD-endopeptidase MepM/ murein hydrolase activator NlpD